MLVIRPLKVLLVSAEWDTGTVWQPDPDPLAGFKEWASGKGKRRREREGGRMDTPNF